MDKPKTLLLFSGGFDSTALLLRLLKEGHHVELAYFHYGQQNYVAELHRIAYWEQKFDLRVHYLDVPFHWSTSSVLSDEEGSSYLEMRNLVFLSHALSLAESRGMDNVAIGVISNLQMEHHYADCTPEFLGNFQRLSKQATGINLLAPFRNDTKELVAIKTKREHGDAVLREVLEHTVSCNYTDLDGEVCGKCGECEAVETLHSYLDPLVK